MAEGATRERAKDTGVSAPAATTSASRRLPTSMTIILWDDQGVIGERTLRGDVLRYGENPDQRGVLFQPEGREHRELMGRKPVSYNNENDTNSAFGLVEEIDRALPLLRDRPGDEIVAIIKHGVACGLAIAETQVEAYRLAFATDMESAFGGILMTNREFTLQTMEALRSIEPIMDGERQKGHFVEVIAAPSFGPGVLESMEARTKSTIRFIPFTAEWSQERDGLYSHFSMRSLLGGRILLQDPQYTGWGGAAPWTVVSARQPTQSEIDNALTALITAKWAPSNVFAYARDYKLLAIAAGSQKRSDAAWIAGERAKRNSETLLKSGLKGVGGIDLRGSSAATDGFCPFPDSVDEAHRYGATALISPHGGKRDREVIERADSYGMAMLHYEGRFFRH